MGIMEISGSRPVRLVSCYLKHGRCSDELNATTLGLVGEALDNCGDDEVCVMGGDFNQDLADLISVGYDRRIAATLFHTATERGTFRTAKARTTIDYFFVGDRLAAAVQDVRTVEASGVRGHVPVQLVFKPRLATIRALHIRQPPRLATERVYGPLPPPRDWSTQAGVAEVALAAARAGSPMTEELLEAACASWADQAEEEIEEYTGTCVAKRGERSKRPRLVWRSVLPEKKFVPTYPSLAAADWLKGIAAELQRITALAAAAAQRRTRRDEPMDTDAAEDDGDTDGDYADYT